MVTLNLSLFFTQSSNVIEMLVLELDSQGLIRIHYVDKSGQDILKVLY